MNAHSNGPEGTLPAGNTIYSSKTSFEDFEISHELKQVQHLCKANALFTMG